VVEQIIRPTGLVDPEIEVRSADFQVDDLIAEIRRTTTTGERTLVTTLTKRMAEDLTEYLGDLNIRVRYMHSDVNTIDRIELVRDLRLGHYDVLIGINLLREGLDIPEVRLVAVLDADHEGFLRSERSLVQTAGRAARNVNGKVILYANRVTDSMKRAMEEMTRRRRRQLEHNREHKIVPRSITREITDILAEYKDQPLPLPPEELMETQSMYSALPGSLSIDQEIRKLETAMKESAAKLDFENAAALRDQIKHLRQLQLLT
jgi:excinuclease ABC subunit B